MKKVSYFPHDADARRDPKIVALIARHGIAGYGAFWVIIEMLREQEGYKLPCKEWAFSAIATETKMTSANAKELVREMIGEFELLKTDNAFFWSDSLKRRMLFMENKSIQAKNAANKRWEKERKRPERGHSGGNADA